MTNLLETSETGDEPEVKDYGMRMWAGRIPVYICSHCDRQMDSEDDMKLHVLKHYLKEEQEEIFDRLVKDDDNGK